MSLFVCAVRVRDGQLSANRPIFGAIGVRPRGRQTDPRTVGPHRSGARARRITAGLAVGPCRRTAAETRSRRSGPPQGCPGDKADLKKSRQRMSAPSNP